MKQFLVATFVLLMMFAVGLYAVHSVQACEPTPTTEITPTQQPTSPPPPVPTGHIEWQYTLLHSDPKYCYIWTYDGNAPNRNTVNKYCNPSLGTWKMSNFFWQVKGGFIDNNTKQFIIQVPKSDPWWIW
jgi:hypothetical protein